MKKPLLIISIVSVILLMAAFLLPIQSKSFEHVYTEEPKTRYSIIRGEKPEFNNFDKKTCPINASCAGGEITIKLHIL